MYICLVFGSTLPINCSMNFSVFLLSALLAFLSFLRSFLSNFLQITAFSLLSASSAFFFCHTVHLCLETLYIRCCSLICWFSSLFSAFYQQQSGKSWCKRLFLTINLCVTKLFVAILTALLLSFGFDIARKLATYNFILYTFFLYSIMLYQFFRPYINFLISLYQCTRYV